METTISILRIGVKNLVQGHLRTCYLLISRLFLDFQIVNLVYCVAHATIVKFTTRDMWLHECRATHIKLGDHFDTYVILFLCNTTC